MGQLLIWQLRMNICIFVCFNLKGWLFQIIIESQDIFFNLILPKTDLNCQSIAFYLLNNSIKRGVFFLKDKILISSVRVDKSVDDLNLLPWFRNYFIQRLKLFLFFRVNVSSEIWDETVVLVSVKLGQ